MHSPEQVKCCHIAPPSFWRGDAVCRDGDHCSNPRRAACGKLFLKIRFSDDKNMRKPNFSFRKREKNEINQIPSAGAEIHMRLCTTVDKTVDNVDNSQYKRLFVCFTQCIFKR